MYKGEGFPNNIKDLVHDSEKVDSGLKAKTDQYLDLVEIKKLPDEDFSDTFVISNINFVLKRSQFKKTYIVSYRVTLKKDQLHFDKTRKLITSNILDKLPKIMRKHGEALKINQLSIASSLIMHSEAKDQQLIQKDDFKHYYLKENLSIGAYDEETEEV